MSFSNGSEVMMTEYHKVPLSGDGNNTIMTPASKVTMGEILTWWVSPDINDITNEY